ncbi:GNAT family N-acetyltransferase [Bacillus aerolatus]|uniref:GNAT family N-acetyltransferase n=1 Tax=Bacillus aerolatus TaxID=2653354 RepID=A0A6I1FEM8_9BACI|nr:GNAT family N-acetyltransferase [Bacillus aerolatus]KAB7706307.1 GNAT family N-acetyltransferase [Bacillus aerolatus]
MDVKHENGRFFVEKNGETMAELSYVPAGAEQIEVNHTFVSDELRGQGVGGQLINEAVSYAREQNKKIVPTCSYAKAKLEKNSDYIDVLAKNK